ncbi:hypothetical protein Fmac_015755 [Flemingia macrophylla]|uniref:Photolyase/cryptochrome alpha/beta domain-containing protein n=1 Tax=Flemingia macrophylla TaxID=520843 RepID=A0ABD1MFG5_9FABA
MMNETSYLLSFRIPSSIFCVVNHYVLYIQTLSKSSFGFDKIGPYCASFLLYVVSNLRRNLQARGSNLVVRVNKPPAILLELAKVVGADPVYSHREVSHDEVNVDERVEQC